MNPKSILGYTDAETVKLDFDDTPFKTVRYWAYKTMQWHRLGGFVIFKSSKDCYHVVFNREVSWSENMRVVAWVSLLAQNEALKKWLLMQCIKEGSTLRLSPKKEKPSPRIVCRCGKQDRQIRNFLHYRRLVKGMLRRIRLASNEKCVHVV